MKTGAKNSFNKQNSNNNIYQLTKPQLSIWNMEQYYGGSIANITGSILINHPVDTRTLNAALNTVVERYDALRIRISVQDGIPVQYIDTHKSQMFNIVNFSEKNEFDFWVNVHAETPIDLNDEIYKFTIITIGQQIGFVLKLHHLIADAWTFHLIANAVNGIIKGATPDAYSYLDFITAEKDYEASSRYQKDKDYFLSCFGQCNEPVFIHSKQAGSPDANHLNLSINKEDATKIQIFCDQNGISAYSLFITSLAIYMYHIKGEQNLYIGTAVLNRSGRKEKATAGMFVNNVPVLFQIDENQNSLQNLINNAECISKIFRHQKYQYVDMLKDIREQYNFTGKLYDVVVSYQNATLDDGTSSQFHFCDCQGESLNIHINDRHKEGVFHLDYTYQTELFAQKDIKRLHSHWQNLIRDIIDNPNKFPQELKLLSDDEFHQVIHGFNDTAIDYPKEKCIHQLFEERANQSPDAIAVIFNDTDYTYRQIDEMSNSLAHILRKRGVSRDDIVAIIAKRSYKIIVAQLAILKAGGAYMPIDPAYPQDRIVFMLSNADCKIIITFGAVIDGGIDMEDDSIFKGNTTTLENINSSDDLCYVIYTSGSTGTPKGSMVTHKNFVNFCENNDKNSIQVTIAKNCKSFICLGLFTFDMASAEIYLALLNSHKVVLPDGKQLDDLNELARLIEIHEVDFILTVPTRMLSYLNSAAFSKSIQRLKILSLGGETLTNEIVGKLKSYTDAIILNGYGPAETTQGCTWTKVDADITIGKPIANTQIYILGKHLRPLPIGAVGELCISGDGVGRGYLNNHELTAEKFIQNQFVEGERMYKTGDLACWREDGNIKYIGRIDNQVKIRGLRIELGEIETAIAKHSGIKQAVVDVRKDNNERQFICAFYVSDCDTDEKLLRSELDKTLPRYMIPHFFTRLKVFPSTYSGKIDFKLLPSPDFTQTSLNAVYVAPLTEREKVLTRVMESVLGVSSIGMEDNFFVLGGDSLATIEFTAKAHSEGFHFTAQDVYEYPTLASLMKYITEGGLKATRYNKKDFTVINKLLESNMASNKPLPIEQPLGDALITGVTGWLGAHVLDEYLSSNAGIAYCIVRGSDLVNSKNRLDRILSCYFGNKYADCNRIIVIYGDIINPITIDKPIDTIIHCAANVRHYGAYQTFHAVNVKGTNNIIALAKEKGAKLLHISTTSISGNNYMQSPESSPTVFDESKIYIGQSLENVYVRSKFESEVTVLQAKIEGLDAVVIRVGNLSNRYADMKFQKNYHENATLTRLKAFVELRLYPETMQDFPLEFSPVDDTAKAILTIARYWDKDYSVFHVYNPNIIKFMNFASVLAEMGAEICPVTTERFVSAVNGTPHIKETFIHDINKDGRLNFQSNIKLGNDFSIYYLNRMGFEWSPINDGYLEKYIFYFKNIGYWEV
ncbi:MAG: amino acid adenylation domain-containing protein [Lachnospiraceae bacterium]|nr:amino acid adenylation domain-containing protein [Lachnospiraceae bacterium]